MTVARLGYEIDSSGAVVAADNLDDMAAAAKRAEAGSKGLTGGVGKAGKALGGVTFNARMLVPQLSQIGQQFTATGQLGQAVAVQAADIGLAFGVVGTVIGTVAGVALPSLIAAMSSTSEEAERLSQAMKSIEDNTRNAKLELEAMQLGLANIEQVLVQQDINALEAERVRTLDLISKFEKDIGAEARRLKVQYELQLKDIEAQLEEKRSLLKEDIKATAELDKQTHLIESANMFLEAQQRIRNERGAEMARQLKLEQQITDELGQGAVEALKLAGVDLTNLDDAARRAASLAASLGIAFGEAYALANVDFAPLGGGLTPDMPDLLPPSGVPGPADTPGGGGGGVDQRASQVEAFVQSLQTEREQLTAWYAEQQELLAMANASELEAIGGHNEAKLRLETEYNERLRQIQEDQAQYVQGAQAAAQGAALDFLGTLAGQSEGAAKALLAINTGLSIAEAIQNTAVAATRALAELGPIAGPIAAARIKAFGAAQVGLIAANAALRLGSSGAGGGAGSATSAGVTATQSTQTTPQLQRAIVQLQGDRSRFTAEEINDIVKQLQSESGDGVIIEGFTN